MDPNEQICRKFLAAPHLNPREEGKKLVANKGPYNNLIDLCRKYGYNKEVDQLLSNNPPKSSPKSSTPKSSIPSPKRSVKPSYLFEGVPDAILGNLEDGIEDVPKSSIPSPKRSVVISKKSVMPSYLLEGVPDATLGNLEDLIEDVPTPSLRKFSTKSSIIPKPSMSATSSGGVSKTSKPIVSMQPLSSSQFNDLFKLPEPLWNWSVPDYEEPIPIEYPIKRHYKLKSIEAWREKIREVSGISVDLHNFDVNNLQNLYDLYSIYFFNDSLPKVTFEISNKLTQVAGKCKVSGKCKPIIRMSRPIFMNLNLEKDQSTKSGGLECKSRLECLQLVLEHEIMHLVIITHYPSRKGLDSKIYSSHGALFKGLVEAYFGQTQSTHQIGNIIMSDEQGDPVNRAKTSIGQMISFLHKGVLKKGVVTDILTKNMSIIFIDNDSWKVDIEFLRKVNEDDEDYEQLLELQTSIKAKYSLLKSLEIGDEINVKINNEIVNGVVQKLYPISNALDVQVGNKVYKISYSLLSISNKPIVKSSIIKTPRILNKDPKTLTKNDFRVGDRVKTTKGITGTIIKTNPVNGKVKADGSGDMWTIHYSFLELI